MKRLDPVTATQLKNDIVGAMYNAADLRRFVSTEIFPEAATAEQRYALAVKRNYIGSEIDKLVLLRMLEKKKVDVTALIDEVLTESLPSQIREFSIIFEKVRLKGNEIDHAGENKIEREAKDMTGYIDSIITHKVRAAKLAEIKVAKTAKGIVEGGPKKPGEKGEGAEVG